MRIHSPKFYSGRKLRELAILAFLVILVFAGFLKAWAQEEKEILNEISKARKDIQEAKETIEENTAAVREIESGLAELKNAINKLEYSDSTQRDKISEIENKLSKLARATENSRGKLSDIEQKLGKTSYPWRKETETSYIIGCTVDKSDSLVRVPHVSVKCFFGAGSVDSLSSQSVESDSNGGFIYTLPIGSGDHLIYEAKKPGFKPTLDSLTISSNPFLLQIPLSEEYPTRRVNVEIKEWYMGKWKRKLSNRSLTLKLKWGGKIQQPYKTKCGFIPAVEIPIGNKLIQYMVLHNDEVVKDWEPMVASKIPNKWEILVPSRR
jgi:hypothetical protein